MLQILAEVLEIYIRAFERLLRPFSRSLRRVVIGPISVELKGETEREFEEVMAKISLAQRNLADAVTAIDEVKGRYSDESFRLEQLMEDVQNKREEYRAATTDLAKTKELLTEDQEQLRRLLGVNDRRGKFVGFASGIAASLIATGLVFAIRAILLHFSGSA